MLHVRHVGKLVHLDLQALGLASTWTCKHKPQSLAQLTRDISAFASRTKAGDLPKETYHLGRLREMERCFVANAAGFTKRDQSGWKMIGRQNVSLSTDRLQFIGANSHEDKG